VKDLIVGTAGHIDHGKTELVRALTGIDTDRLAEEKRRGITIDIGFAHLQLGDFRVGFIDVPGHERFVKNMLAGIGGIQLLLLVIAADESVMPQTTEHFEICRLLGIRNGIVVLTKRDLVDEELVEVVAVEVRDLVKGSFLSDAPIVSVDSVSGRGIPELKATLQQELAELDIDSIQRRIRERVFLMPVDRVFSIRGFGTVVTGTATAGSIGRDEIVTVQPGGLESKVRGIEIFGESALRSEGGQRTALNLSSLSTENLARGMTVTSHRSLRATQILDARIELVKSAPGPLRQRSPVRFHHGSAELIAKLHLLGCQTIEPGNTAFAQLRLENPTVCLPGDRFILRRYSPLLTVGGGTILDNNPVHHRRKEIPRLIQSYETLETELSLGGEAAESGLLAHLVGNSRIEGIDMASLVSATGLTRETVLSIVSVLPDTAIVKQDPPVALDRRKLTALGEKFREALEEFLRRKPLADGMPKEELRERFMSRATPAVFQFVLDEFQKGKLIEIRGSSIAPYGSRIQMTDEQIELSESIVNLFQQNCFRSPEVEGLAAKLGKDPRTVRDLFFFLMQEGRLIRVSEDLVMLPEQIGEISGRIRASFPDGTSFSVPEFKDLLGVSRKFAIPLLEYLDRQRVTRRAGDRRIIL
jgi:selenocysteine-specific elongation factor